MSGKSAYLENAFLQLLFNKVDIATLASGTISGQLTNLYLSAHTGDPDTAANSQATNETAYPSYARIPLVRTAAGWTITANVVKPTSAVSFPTSTAGTQGGPLTHIGIGTAATGAGTLLFSGALSPTISMAEGVIPQILATSAITES